MYDMVVQEAAAGRPIIGNKVNDGLAEKIPTESESSNNVRKNFPESWIWLNEVTGWDKSTCYTIQVQKWLQK